MSIGQIFLKKLGSLDTIFSKKTILFISNKVYKDLKANKARWTSPITKKALRIEELCFLLKILTRKPSFLKIIWSTDMMSLYSIVTQLVRAWSFYIHWWCLPCFIRHEILKNFVGRKQNCFFPKYLSLFYVCLLISCTGLKTNSPTSLLDFTCWRVGVGELNRRQLDWIPFKKPIHFHLIMWLIMNASHVKN